MTAQVLLASRRVANTAMRRLISRGRGSLKLILGDDACRLRLLGEQIHWDRVLIYFQDDQPLGYAALKYKQRGPFSLHVRPFWREFGYLRGSLRFGLFYLSEQRERRYAFLLYGLRVEREARNRGIGGQLLEAACEQARNAGFDCISLEVPLRNERARRLYRHHGFYERPRPWFARLLPWPRVCVMQRTLSLEPRP